MTPQVTVCIPVGPYHVETYKRAVLSVQVQTFPCKIAVLIDDNDDPKGPGFIRNRLVEKVDTDFIIFLDADDELMPDFVSNCVSAFNGKYIYTDWYNSDGEVRNAPDCAWTNGTWHLITSLIPTSFHKLIGGFNESLKGLEDADYYIRMVTAGLCGTRFPMPLVHYSAEGVRSKEARSSGLEDNLKKEFVVKYGSRVNRCCGEESRVVALPPGNRGENDILAITLWSGNHTEMGRSTGRVYPRSGNGRTMWVDPKDILASPHLWRGVDPVAMPDPPTPIIEIKPDIATVLRFAKSKSTDPVFAYVDKIPDSYRDIFHLIKASGFSLQNITDISPDGNYPVIVLTPYALPMDTISLFKRKVVCWQLEYAGDYTGNYDGFDGEVWASDSLWARNHKAKYVILGSDPRLALGFRRDVSFRYDVTMLGYMVERRQKVKDLLSSLKWPIDYPGHHGLVRGDLLKSTAMMLHVHQHTGEPYCAPQRLAVAAAFHMPVLSENEPLQKFKGLITYVSYDKIPDALYWHLEHLKLSEQMGETLHQFLCVDNTFRKCVEEALK